MYKNKKILCVVPARGGSKGLPGKNIRKLLGKPLIAYTLEHAARSKYIDRTIVSTDSKEIIAVARKWGAEVPFIRPKRLALDRATTIDVLLHAMDWMEKKEKFDFDILVLLHVTTPLRKPEDIDKSIELALCKGVDNVFSVVQAQRNPYFNMVELDPFGMAHLSKKGTFSCRQSAPKVFDMNCAVYVWRKEVLKKKKSLFPGHTRVYVMAKERSIDIDDIWDFKVAEVFLKNE